MVATRHKFLKMCSVAVSLPTGLLIRHCRLTDNPIIKEMPDQVGHEVCYGMSKLFSDALSCNVQIANKTGLKFQQNQLKVDTNIVLYQVLFWANP